MKKWSFLFIIGFILFACDENTENAKKSTSVVQKKKPKRTIEGIEIVDAGAIKQYTGKPGQLLLVAENTEYIPEIEVLFDSIFSAPIRPYYPPTPYFEIFYRNPAEFQKSFTSFRNIVNFKIDENIPKNEPELKVFENYYSRTQIYTQIKAHDMQDLVAVFHKNINSLFKIYEQQEWRREFRRFKKHPDGSAAASIAKKFGIEFRLPDNFRYESIDDTYAILIFPQRSRPMDLKVGNATRSAVNFIQSGIMIWQYPADEFPFTPESLLQMRDTILKKYARHEMEGVYMGTQDHPAVLPVHEALQIGEVKGYQFRGLYKFTGEAEPSGGRFWSFHFIHPKRKNIVAISGYFDVPPTMSPHLDINKIRAVLYSLEILD